MQEGIVATHDEGGIVFSTLVVAGVDAGVIGIRLGGRVLVVEGGRHE